ncbi:hypothetical protein HG535_0D05240 [Zygotorulaspora mrakii]|uniref:Uncharacterized protein n=1 Tax=Zygotorulaspora mrakii TaxID=42260 RepID=A0A7H9B2D2_ZYGMR|nr:uncharacterized protein HG535_0D05240 [Zygotorulaspora mrakii]QLG72815.1 hypothetical protein HG535_0D05240 [Zygotorulaspora mrakii]
MSYSTSLTYAKGRNGHNQDLHYFVDLNHTHQSSFEIPHSICLLDHYDHLILFFECQMGTGGAFVVPLFDIIVILMTLATISDHHKEQILRNNDPYNATRSSLGKRALKLLRFYIKTLKDFDHTEKRLYDLELLRCQFFIVIDQLFVNTSLKNPYASYISCLEQKSGVLGTEFITSTIGKRANFLNTILWTFSNSLQDDRALYTSIHEVWMPIQDIMLDLIELRHDYYIRNEIDKGDGRLEIFKALARSPLARFLTSMDSSRQFSRRFCGYIFIMCDYKSNLKATEELQIYPVHRGEESFSPTFVSRVRYTRDYKLQKSFLMQRRFLKICFRLYLDIPAGFELSSPSFNLEDLVEEISKNLAEFNDIKQFEAFFFANYRQSLHMMPYIAQTTLIRIFSGFIDRSQKKSISLPKVNLVDILNNADSFLTQCISLFQEGFFMLWDIESKNSFILDNMKADTCLIVLLNRMQYLNGKSTLIDSKYYDEFVSSINKNDSERRDIINRHFLGEEVSDFHSVITQLLDI